MQMNTGGSKVPFYQGMIGFGQHHNPIVNSKPPSNHNVIHN